MVKIKRRPSLGLNYVWSRYRAEQYDSDLGLYYLRARYMNPLTGRFVNRDPENGIVTDPKTLHKYLYAGGDPVNAKDPSGRDDEVEYTTLEKFLLVPLLDASVNYSVAGQVATYFGFTAYVNCILLGTGDFLVYVASGFKEGFLPNPITQACFAIGFGGGVAGSSF